MQDETKAREVLIQNGAHEDTDRAIGLVPYAVAIRAMIAFASAPPDGEREEEYVTVSLSRDGTVTTHNAFDADFDEMVAATEKIIKALSIRLSDRKFCPYSHGAALKTASLSHQADRAAIAREVEQARADERERCAALADRHTPAAAGGPFSHTNSMRVVLIDAAKGIRALPAILALSPTPSPRFEDGIAAAIQWLRNLDVKEKPATQGHSAVWLADQMERALIDNSKEPKA